LPVPGDLVTVRYTKWDGSLHWHFDMDLLGRDEHGTWLGSARERPLQRGLEPEVFRKDLFVGLIPSQGDWTAYWNERSRFELYVDVTSRPTWSGREVTAIDLDLDVVRWRDSRVEVLDEDEFLEHQVRYRYPRDTIEGARRTASYLVQAVATHQEPFGATGRWWLDYLVRQSRSSPESRS
jgi:hypothetical protein